MFLCTCTHTQNCETCVCVCVCHHPTFPNVTHLWLRSDSALVCIKKKIFVLSPCSWRLVTLNVNPVIIVASHPRPGFFVFFCSARAEKHTSDPWSAIKASARHLSQQRSDCWAEATASKDVLSFSSPMTRKKKKKTSHHNQDSLRADEWINIGALMNLKWFH